MSVIECSIAFAIGALVIALLIAHKEWKNANEWQETALRHQDAAAKARMDAEEAKIWLAEEKALRRTLEGRVQFMEKSAQGAMKRENEAKDALQAERDKCDELRRMLDETRKLLDEERADREAFELDREKLEREKRLMIEMNNVFRYNGTAHGQVSVDE